MKPFIYSVIFLFSIHVVFAQNKEIILNKSYKVNKNTVLNLDLDNVGILFEESFDDKIHFDYTITFGRYSKRKRNIILKGVKTNVSQKNNLLNLNVKNSEFIGISNKHYRLYDFDFKNDSTQVTLKDLLKNKYIRNYSFKSKDSLLREIKLSIGSDFDDMIKRNKDEFLSRMKNMKLIVKVFKIKIPRYVKVRIKSINSDLTFNYETIKPLHINSFKGFLKFKNIIAVNNKISISNGVIQAYSIRNADLDFRDMYKVVFGSITNSTLTTETSKIQFGEVGKNVSITDFDSKLYLYNFSKNFTKFNLKGDYSELNFYNIRDNNFSMDVSGFNTTLNMNGVKTTFGVSKEEKMTKILQKKIKENILFLGAIEVELKHGILNLK